MNRAAALVCVLAVLGGVVSSAPNVRVPAAFVGVYGGSYVERARPRTPLKATVALSADGTLELRLRGDKADRRTAARRVFVGKVARDGILEFRDLRRGGAVLSGRILGRRMSAALLEDHRPTATLTAQRDPLQAHHARAGRVRVGPLPVGRPLERSHQDRVP